jgi:hypothetical protein
MSQILGLANVERLVLTIPEHVEVTANWAEIRVSESGEPELRERVLGFKKEDTKNGI